MPDETPPLERFTRAFWDRRYSEHRHVWSGNPNAQLVAYAGELDPGPALHPRRALEVACGEGADAIWLAQRGWSLTAIDVSPVALAKAAEHARRAGEEVAARIDWRELDLVADEPVKLGEFELVSSHYLHLPPELRERVLERLAAAVASGGRLLFVAHHPADLAIPGLRPNLPELFHTAEELAAQLDPAAWEVLDAAAPAREAKGPHGEPVTVHDAVLFARRRR
ncbi:MAG: class I SAM-dependent methyltransferase [Solirubrobacteraceae bacterium]